MGVFQFLFWALLLAALGEAVLLGLWFSPRFRQFGAFTLVLCSSCLAIAICTAGWM